MVAEDYLEVLVGQAHQIINDISLHEFIDLEREDAETMIAELYPGLSPDEVDRYLSVLALLRALIDWRHA